MKIEWLVTDVTPVGSPGRAERTILEGILVGRVFCQFTTYLWSLSHFVMYEPPLELYQLYLGSFSENGVVPCQCDICRIP